MKLIMIKDEETQLVVWKNLKGEIVTKFNDESIVDYPEDLIGSRDIGDLVREAYEKGIEDGVNSILEDE
jgi:hypothetical protein